MINDILIESGKFGLNLQRSDGSMPPGHNGPYNDPETPVRNTAHWLFLFSTLFERTNESCWKKAGEKSIDYLMSDEARPYGKTFFCRNKPGKDSCNGLVGQAWVIEALLKADEVFDRKDCYNLAEKIFLMHPWDENVGLWHRVEIDGKKMPFDGTFNHQLWFAAAGSLFKKNDNITYQARLFLENIGSNVQLYPNGVIFHSSCMGKLNSYAKCGFKPFSEEFIARLNKKKKWNELYSKSVGYHAFNLYAFAILNQSLPNETIWKSKVFEEVITAHRDINFQKDLKKSKFGYYYNVSGFEISYAIETFFHDKIEAKLWLNNQLEKTYVDQNNVLTRNTDDLNTSYARVYELCRFVENYELQIC